MKNNNIIGGFIILAAMFTACNETDFDAVPKEKLMGDSLKTTYTIERLEAEFKDSTDLYSDILRKATNSGLFTTDTINSNNDIVISGVVTSSDADGNVYKYITVQETNGQAIKISIDASGLSAIFPLGQRVWIRCNGLYLGKYAQSPQIGTLYFNPTKFTVKDSVTVYRKEPGRIPLPIALKAIHAYGMPDASLIKVDTLTIQQIRAGGSKLFNKLVCIKNAFFTGRGADYGVPVALNSESEYIFAPSTNGVGYPQSREIQDGTGSIFVSTSEYAKFANTKLPSSDNIGNITAIIGWYNDKKPTVKPDKLTTEIYHQLTIRSLDDLGKGFERFHATVGN